MIFLPSLPSPITHSYYCLLLSEHLLTYDILTFSSFPHYSLVLLPPSLSPLLPFLSVQATQEFALNELKQLERPVDDPR